MSGIEKVNQLTQEQRETALKQARLRIAGPEPEAGSEPAVADFLNKGGGKFPPRLLKWTNWLSILMLVVTFFPSAVRLHEAGRLMAGRTITDVATLFLAAWCVVFMAEIGQVIFSLAGATQTNHLGWLGWNWQRIGLTLGALTCTLIALIGNADMEKPWEYDGFAWLLTFAPPFLVLITSNVLKSNALHSIEDRHTAQTQFIEAHAAWMADGDARLSAWRDAFTNAHLDADWQRTVANALRDALRRANRASTRVMRELSNTEWYELIHRELRADQWYIVTETQVRAAEEQREVDAQPVVRVRAASANRSGASGGVHTGELADTVREVDGMHVATCPHCAREFSNPTPRGAKNALVAHVRHAHRAPANEAVEAGANGRA